MGELNTAPTKVNRVESTIGQVKVGGGPGVTENWENPEAALEYVIDGGGVAITTGEKGHLEVPFDCVITASALFADQSGSIKIDIWKDTYANFPPTNADSICGGNEPEIVAAQKDLDNTLTGWTTACSKGDILAFNVDSCVTITRCTVSLKVNKT